MCIRDRDVPIPAPGPGEALIQIEAAGICAGDRVTYQGLAPWGIDAVSYTHLKELYYGKNLR